MAQLRNSPGEGGHRNSLALEDPLRSQRRRQSPTCHQVEEKNWGLGTQGQVNVSKSQVENRREGGPRSRAGQSRGLRTWLRQGRRVAARSD